jgi:hypothetical protein
MAEQVAPPREPSTDIPVRRISAFIYGNILVLSALVALSPGALQTTRGFIHVLGVGFSTFVAHVASDLFAHLLRHPDGTGLSARLRRDLREALPIATSAILPTVILVVAWLGWLRPELCWAVAIGVALVHCFQQGDYGDQQGEQNASEQRPQRPGAAASVPPLALVNARASRRPASRSVLLLASHLTAVRQHLH